MRGLFVLSLVCALGSCNSLLVVTGDGEGLPCQDDGDCSDGLKCIDSTCARPIVSDGGSRDAGGSRRCGEVITCYGGCHTALVCASCRNGLCANDEDEYTAFESCCAPLCGGTIGVGCYSNCVTSCSGELRTCNDSNCN